ncbi:Ig-like domain-containing protein [Gracilimonas sp.]|uniref:Ig-like domain-containing protein n=1 Tax=Gracilimonas sp. TaxID=1974203 RepID=UPI0028715FDA|nr:Ig-like domain-containing protein [Gracilimonas sp.]
MMEMEHLDPPGDDGTTTTNPSDIGDNYRVRVTYNELSTFRISVGSAGGPAYFGLEFAIGPYFDVDTGTIVVVEAPTVDLDINTNGYGREVGFIGNELSFTENAQTNIPDTSSTPSQNAGSSSLDELRVQFDTSDILNGSDEKLIIDGATSGGSIDLDFSDGDPISNVIVGGVTFEVTASVSGDKSSLSFAESGGDSDIADMEMLLDALRYDNEATVLQTGVRNFEVVIRDGAYDSPYAPLSIDVPSVVADLSTSTISASPSTITADGVSTSTITVQLKDNSGTNLTESAGDVSLSNSGTGTLSAVTDNDDGSYTATLTAPLTAGSAVITADYEGQDLTHSSNPVTVNFTAGSATKVEFLQQPGDENAGDVFSPSITVRLLDTNDNLVESDGVNISLAISGGQPWWVPQLNQQLMALPRLMLPVI